MYLYQTLSWIKYKKGLNIISPKEKVAPTTTEPVDSQTITNPIPLLKIL